jgi:hypothetical protein
VPEAKPVVRGGVPILPKLRTGSDLNVGIDFSVTVPAGSATALMGELRQVLDELGLANKLEVQ